MPGALELLTKLASVGKVTIEKATELGEAIGNQIANSLESAGDAAAKAGADKTMAYMMDKATPGMGQKANDKDKAKDDGLEM
jgi:hypothetical protein